MHIVCLFYTGNEQHFALYDLTMMQIPPYHFSYGQQTNACGLRDLHVHVHT